MYGRIPEGFKDRTGEGMSIALIGGDASPMDDSRDPQIIAPL